MSLKSKIGLILFLLILSGAGGFWFLRSQNPKSGSVIIQNLPPLPPAENKGAAEPEVVPANEPAPVNIPPEEKLPAPKRNVPDESPTLSITKKIVSFGFAPATGRKIDTIIIHSSYNALGGNEYDLEKLIAEYKEYGVAPHYLIDRKGKIYQLVEEKNIAYHAGESKVPDGRTQVNNFSLGIEVMATEEEGPTADQYSSLKALLSDIRSRYSIKYNLGHSDIAKSRKTDPWNFDWDKIQKIK